MKKSPLVPLYTLNLGETGVVCILPCDIDIRQRLMAFGLIGGTKITAVHVSPSNNMKAYFFRGTVIALRHKDAEDILIKQQSIQ